MVAEIHSGRTFRARRFKNAGARGRSTGVTVSRLLNPDYPAVLRKTVDYLAEAVLAEESEIGIPVSGAYLNGFLFACGRARIVGPSNARTLEVALLGAARSSGWRHHAETTAISIPADESPGHLHLLRRLKFGMADLFTESVTSGFARTWDPDRLEQLCGFSDQVGMTRGFLETGSDAGDDTELDGHVFRRVAGHWVWTGRVN